ncbi:hypothetical protein [Streptomyces qinglanensis]|nr:hypothetical protein [Streptomyces qinglanensis]
MSGELDALVRRHRRLNEMKKGGQVDAASQALRELWEAGKKPQAIALRHSFFDTNQPPPPMAGLLNPRGIAMRFYLLALFEAQCRLDVGEQRVGSRPIAGRNGWADLVAIDGAYDAETGKYMRGGTKQDRDLETLRLRQVQGALRTMEKLGNDRHQALVDIPTKDNGHRLYDAFTLMAESGRGRLQTPDRYSVPKLERSKAFRVPAAFFLNGWVQVLHPSEIATWLIFQALSQHFPGKHDDEGNFLVGDVRKRFGLRRDAYEDARRRLCSFGLLRIARPKSEQTSIFSQPIAPRERYEPHRYQVVHGGLGEKALDRCLKEITFLQNELRKRKS